MSVTELRIPTPQGVISGVQSGSQGLPILFLHSASASSAAFVRQMESDLAARHRLIAIDLPGHGRSANAAEPAAAYSVAGFATTVGDVIDTLEIESVVLVGWSLGGHIAIDLMTWHPAVAGAMLIATPPVPRGPLGLIRGFQLGRDVLLASKPNFSDDDAARYFRTCFGEAGTPEMLDAIKRADGRARRANFNGLLRSDGFDEKVAVAETHLPLAVVNGAAEPFARLNYIAGLNYGNLWEGRCHILHESGHAPFLQEPEQFNALLDRFAGDVAAIDALRRVAQKAYAAAG
jgi:pimeloyl-ACP methyl ester carboxylesterase